MAKDNAMMRQVNFIKMRDVTFINTSSFSMVPDDVTCTLCSSLLYICNETTCGETTGFLHIS